MQTLELSKMELATISQLEMQEIDGGSWPSWIKGIGIGWVADQIIKNWDDIKDGLKDGYNMK